MKANLDSDLCKNNDQPDTDQIIKYFLSEQALRLKSEIKRDKPLEMATGIKVEINELNHLSSQSQNSLKQLLDNDFMISEEVMKLLKISKRTLYTYRKTKKIPFQRLGRKIYYSRAKILLLIQ